MAMKKLNIFPILTLITTINLFGATGCVDHSYHMKLDTYYESIDPAVLNLNALYHDPDERPLDSKKYRPVYNCTCPCNEYVITEDRGFCAKCLHFGRADRKYTQNNTQEPLQSELDQFALLKKVIDERKAQEKQELKQAQQAG